MVRKIKIMGSMAFLLMTCTAFAEPEDGLIQLKDQICSMIADGDLNASDMGLNQINADYAGHPDLPKMLYKIAGQYENECFFPRAKALNELIAASYPDTKQALKAGLRAAKLAIANDIDKGNYPQAEASITQMKADYAQQEKLKNSLCKSLYQIAYKWEQKSESERSLRTFQQLSADGPDMYWGQVAALQACRLAVQVLVDAGDEAGAKTAIEQMKIKYADQREVLTGMLNQIAWHYFEANQFEESAHQYRQLINTYPDVPEAFHAYRGLGLASVYTGDDNAVKEAVAGLVVHFGDSKYFADAICLIAKQYRLIHQYDKALELYNHALSLWPKDKMQSFWYRWLKTHQHICRNEVQEALAVIDELFTDYADHDSTGIVFFRLGSDFYRTGNVEEACIMYEIASEKNHNETWALSAQVARILLDPVPATAKDVTARWDILNEMKLFLPENANSAEAVFNVVEELYMIGVERYRNSLTCPPDKKLADQADKDIEKALECCDLLIANLFPQASSLVQQEVYLYKAYCHFRLKQYEQAAVHCEILLSEWNYHYDYYARMVLANAYTWLLKQNAVDIAEATIKVEQALKAVLDENIDPDLNAYALYGLAQFHFQNNQWRQAVEYLEQLLCDYSNPPDRRIPFAAEMLVKAYQEIGEPELAEDIRNIFLSPKEQ